MIQRLSRLPRLRWYEYSSCQTIIMLGVKEWQERELDHFSLNYNQAEREEEGGGKHGEARNWEYDLNSPVLTTLR